MDIEDDKHLLMLEAIMPHAKQTNTQKLTPLYIDYKVRKTKLVLVLCPQWSIYFPPYNLPRLSGIAKTAGYESTVIDLNIRSYHKYKSEWTDRIHFDPWGPGAAWHWTGENYYTELHPTLKPFLDQNIQEILSMNPHVVGFSMYYTNEEPTKYMCSELKRINPNIKIVIGGSNVQKSWFVSHEYYDYVVKGEGEQALLNILNDLEFNSDRKKTIFIIQPEEQRININQLPFPDYDNINFSDYPMSNAVTTEFSRGCIAKCTFCEETHFWKFRQRQSIDLVTEIEWLYKNKGVDIVWFVDSLINGNLKELKNFADSVVEKKLKIKWGGYARHDGRMDLEYFKKLKASGCVRLNFGSESGSQNVLDYMDKKVTVSEMEQNFKDVKAVGMTANTNWIVGAPIERLDDFNNTLEFLWKIKDCNVSNMSTGVGFAISPETIIGQNPSKFNISYFNYNNFWISKNFDMGGTHVLNRVKNITIFLDMLTGRANKRIGYTKRESLPKDHYKITFNSDTINDLKQEQFDYYIIKPNINPYADSLVNEIWPLLRILYRCFGGYTMELKFSPDIDMLEFGSQHGSGKYYATHKFKISDLGQWEADFHYKFIQGNSGDKPFKLQDYSDLNANTITRAKQLARNTDKVDKDHLLSIEDELNNTMDFSFEYTYIDKGSWGIL